MSNKLASDVTAKAGDNKDALLNLGKIDIVLKQTITKNDLEFIIVDNFADNAAGKLIVNITIENNKAWIGNIQNSKTFEKITLLGFKKPRN